MEKISSREFKKLLESNYLFHFHTNYTDGKCSVREYFSYAYKHKVQTIIFTEHVRRKLSYRFDRFLQDIYSTKTLYGSINAVIGVEAKILPGGGLDIPDDILDKIQLICFACHFFPVNVQLYEKSFKRLFLEAKWKPYIRVWVHPGIFFRKQRISVDGIETLRRLADIAKAEGVFIENNLRARLPPQDVISKCEEEEIIIGFDAHDVEDIERLNG